MAYISSLLMIAEEGGKTGNIPPPNFQLIAERNVIFLRHPSIYSPKLFAE
jgi:hypothetical protein